MSLLSKISPEDLMKLRLALPTMPEKQKRRTAELLKQYQQQLTQALAKDLGSEFPSRKFDK